MSNEDNEFPVEATIDEYRKAYEAGDKARCAQLRESWKQWQGEDSLHEMAFGEP